MRSKTWLASALLAFALTGALLVSPGLAQDEDDLTLVDLSLGFVYEEDFEDDDGGWTTTEIPAPPPRQPSSPSWEHAPIPTEPARLAPSDVWEWGEPTYGPDGAASGTNAWGTDLDADYEQNDCAGLISPVIDLTDATSASIAFDHWRHLRSTSTLAYGSGVLYATEDGGKTLTRLTPAGGYDKNMITASRNCQDGAPSGTKAYTDESAGWVTDSADLSDFLDRQIQIVFGFAASSSTTVHAGWYLDNFEYTIDGVTVLQTFEASDGGFAPVALHPPAGSLPPGGAASGTQAWATFPTGALSQTECSGIMSPPLDLSGANTASASFQHWYEMRQLSTSAPQAALVFATTDGGDTLELIEPDGGYFSSPITSTATRNCLDEVPSGTAAISGGPPTGWQGLSFDLANYLGEDDVQLVLGFRKDTVGDYSGWYVDDFATTIDGVTAVEDFESGDGGFTVVGVQPPPHPRGWEWGEPSVGPGVVNNTLWGTQLHRDYGHFECSWIESPPFQVGPLPNEANAVLDATLTWQQWYRSNSIYASGVLQVGHGGEYATVEPEGGYPATIGSTLSSFAEITQWQTDCFGMDWQPGDPLERAYSGLQDSEGAELGEQRADLTAWAGEEITLRFLFASGWRDANPTTYPGWYVDDVGVELRVVASIPNPEQLLEGGVQAPGWTSGGPDNEWAYGLVGSGPSGAVAYGTNLNGPYTTPHCGYIESPAVAGDAFADDPTLSFEHWYRISQSGSFAWYAGVVLVSVDDGASWSVVSFPEQFTASTAARGCVNEVAGVPTSPSFTGFGGSLTEWGSAAADLSGLVGAESVRLRFVLAGTTTTIGCSDEDPCEGWFLRNVVLGGQLLLPGEPLSLVPEPPL